MNSAGDDKDMNGECGESSRTNCEHNGETATLNPPHNDCGKHSDAIVNGALPKVKHLFRNIPNGITAINADDTLKVNNNVAIDNTEMGASSDFCTSSDTDLKGRLNGVNINGNNGLGPPINGVDSYLRNNVNYRSTVDKCPLKVRECSNVSLSNNMSGLVLKSNGCAKLDGLEKCEGGSGVARWEDDGDTSSSDTGNEAEDGLSADECCIYTYKGDQMADLPRSFFSLDAACGEQAAAVGGREEMPENNGGQNSRSSSPEMDFLEMDFDPGPSCEQDSEEDSECGSLRDEEAEFYADIHPQDNVNGHIEEASNDLSTAPNHNNDLGNVSVGLPAPVQDTHNEEPAQPTRVAACPALSLPYNRNAESNCGERTTRDVWGHHCSGGDLCSPGESSTAEEEAGWQNGLDVINEGIRHLQHGDDPRKSNLHSAQYHCIMAKRLVLNKHALYQDEHDSHLEHRCSAQAPPVERTMIWSEREACVKQVTQISTSACGATAVINVLVAMNVSFALDRVREAVGTRLRADSAPLPAFLLARSAAGSTHVDMIRGLEQASEGAVCARFFPMHPQPPVSLSCWLAYWMKKGAVPIATLNLQQGIAPGNLIPDAWHHQMIFGVGPEGVYLTNALESVSEPTLWPQLASPSVLLVRRADVVDRWNQHTDLRPLAALTHSGWKTLNVLGQVVNVIRENASQGHGRVVTPHVMIPASYSSGITLAVGRESPAYHELFSAPELV